MTAIIALSLFFVFLPWLVLIVILVNKAVADHRERKRHGWEVDPIDRDFVRLCYVTLLIAVWLKGW
jgi:hypothetical protein